MSFLIWQPVQFWGIGYPAAPEPAGCEVFPMPLISKKLKTSPLFRGVTCGSSGRLGLDVAEKQDVSAEQGCGMLLFHGCLRLKSDAGTSLAMVLVGQGRCGGDSILSESECHCLHSTLSAWNAI